MQEDQPIKLPFYARLALTLLAIMLIFLIMDEAKSLMIPLFFSLLIALMLLPITRWLERRKLSRSVSAFLAILLFILFVTGLFDFLGTQIGDFAKDLPHLGQKIQVWIQSFQNWVSLKYHVDASHQLQYLNRGADKLAAYASMIVQTLLLAVGGFAIWTIFVFIFTFFLLTHRSLLHNFITCLFAQKDQPRVNEVLNETRILANSYVLGLLIEMLIVAGLNIIAFLVFGVQYAFLLGVLAAVLNLIPYLGIYSATAIAAIITLSDSTPNHALVVIIILLVIHFIDANLLMPRIVGRRVKMNPLITIVAVLLGNLLWGIPGMFLFIPLFGILKIIFERVDDLKPWAIIMGTEMEAREDPPRK